MYVPEPGDADLWDGLMASWLLALEAEGKSPRTVVNYRWAPVQLAAWLTDHGHRADVAALTGEQVREWLAHLGRTRSENTARSRYVGLRQFISWCMAEGELDADPMANVRQPTVHEVPADMLTDQQTRDVLASTEGTDFASVRDRALVLLFADTGLRLGAVAGLRLQDVDLRERTARVTTKGGKHLVAPIGATTARALDRYLRARRRQPYGDREWFWLSTTGKGKLTANGIQQALRRRGRRLGIPNLHPHMFRHGFAHAWLSAGGSEGDLMELAGWNSRQMLQRYGRQQRAERARAAHRRLSPMDAL